MERKNEAKTKIKNILIEMGLSYRESAKVIGDLQSELAEKKENLIDAVVTREALEGQDNSSGRQEDRKISRAEAIAVIMNEIKTDPVKIKAFIVDVLGREWEEHF